MFLSSSQFDKYDKIFLTTKDMHCFDGKYTEERQSVHTDISKSLLIGDPSTEQPESILLGGGSGSGKSWLAKITIQAFMANGKDVVHIDSDEIKTMLPEYREMVNVVDGSIIPLNENWSDILHDESSDIAFDVLLTCIKERRNFIYDGTMKNLAKYKRIIELLKKDDYFIEIIVVDVSVEEALIRVEKREKAIGRHVPKEIVVESHQKVVETFYILKDMVDDYTLYDTSGNSPSIFAEKVAKIEKILDSERLQEFYKKGDDFLGIDVL